MLMHHADNISRNENLFIVYSLGEEKSELSEVSMQRGRTSMLLALKRFSGLIELTGNCDAGDGN
jgi:hypothetical protein